MEEMRWKALVSKWLLIFEQGREMINLDLGTFACFREISW